MLIARNIKIALAATAVAGALLMGCVSQETASNDGNSIATPASQEPQRSSMTPPQGAPPTGFRARGNFTGNITPEQGAQFEEMRALATEACSGKAENETCAYATTRGETSGTCTERNGTLSCAPQRKFSQPHGTPGAPNS